MSDYDRGERSERRGGNRGGRRRRKVCTFCVDKVEVIDYKDTAKLRRFISERGKICLLYTSAGDRQDGRAAGAVGADEPEPGVTGQ